MRSARTKLAADDADLFTDYIDFAVEGVAPVVVELGDVTVEEKITVLAYAGDACGVLATSVAAIG